MKIIVFAAYYHPHVGGYCKNIHELSKRLVERGHEVTIWTSNTENSAPYDKRDGVLIVRLPVWDALNKSFPIPKPSGMLRDLFQQKADVVLTQTRFFPHSLLGCIYSMVKHVPMIHVERGTVHTVMGNKILGFLAQVYDHTVGTFVVKHAKQNVGVSQAACRFIGHISGKNTRVLYNGIQMREYQSSKHNSPLNIVYVGRLIFAKGCQDLIEAYKDLRARAYDVHLTIVGDGNYRKELEAMGHGHGISFTGELDQPAVMAMLRMSDIFVNPSYSEGLPTSVMEAASVGLPIIATDVGGTNEIIEDDKSGLLYKAGDVAALTRMLRYLLDNPDRAKVFGERAKENARKFDWEKITEQYETLLKEVVG